MEKNLKKGTEKVEKPAEKSAKSFDVEAKIKKIEDSKLTEAEKSAYIRKLKNEAAPEGLKISFAVYCERKKIPLRHREPMKFYPAAKGVMSCTFEGWEEIYKNF